MPKLRIPKQPTVSRTVLSRPYDGGTHTKETPLECNVTWVDYGNRLRPTADQLKEEYGLEDVTLTLLRDIGRRKSSFQPRAKGKVVENWTDEDKISCNPHSLLSPFTGTGQFYLTLLGSQYRMCGMTNPYLKFKDRTTGRDYDVAKITQIDGSLMIEVLPDSRYLSDSDYAKMFKFLCKPVTKEVGFLSDGMPICLYPETYIDFELASWGDIPSIDASNPAYKVPNSRFTIRGIKQTVETFVPKLLEWEEYVNGDYVVKSRSTTVPQYVTTFDTVITVDTTAPKQYVLDWLQWHPLSPSMSKVKAVAYGAKPDRPKDARDRRYKRTRSIG